MSCDGRVVMGRVVMVEYSCVCGVELSCDGRVKLCWFSQVESSCDGRVELCWWSRVV